MKEVSVFSSSPDVLLFDAHADGESSESTALAELKEGGDPVALANQLRKMADTLERAAGLAMQLGLPKASFRVDGDRIIACCYREDEVKQIDVSDGVPDWMQQVESDGAEVMLGRGLAQRWVD